MEAASAASPPATPSAVGVQLRNLLMAGAVAVGSALYEMPLSPRNPCTVEGDRRRIKPGVSRRPGGRERDGDTASSGGAVAGTPLASSPFRPLRRLGRRGGRSGPRRSARLRPRWWPLGAVPDHVSTACVKMVLSEVLLGRMHLGDMWDLTAELTAMIESGCEQLTVPPISGLVRPPVSRCAVSARHAAAHGRERTRRPAGSRRQDPGRPGMPPRHDPRRLRTRCNGRTANPGNQHSAFTIRGMRGRSRATYGARSLQLTGERPGQRRPSVDVELVALGVFIATA